MFHFPLYVDAVVSFVVVADIVSNVVVAATADVAVAVVDVATVVIVFCC